MLFSYSLANLIFADGQFAHLFTGEPSPCSSPYAHTPVTAGLNFSKIIPINDGVLLLTSDGALYALGANTAHRFGTEEARYDEPTLLDFFDEPIKDAAYSRSEAILVLTRGGTLFLMGNKTFVKDVEDPEIAPQKLELQYDPDAIFAAYNVFYVKCKDKLLYYGFCTRGLCGTDGDGHFVTDFPSNFTLEFRRFLLPMMDGFLKDVVTGDNALALISVLNDVWLVGDNAYSKLCVPTSRAQLGFAKPSLLSITGISNIFLGLYTTVLQAGAQTYICGRNQYDANDSTALFLDNGVLELEKPTALKDFRDQTLSCAIDETLTTQMLYLVDKNGGIHMKGAGIPAGCDTNVAYRQWHHVVSSSPLTGVLARQFNVFATQNPAIHSLYDPEKEDEIKNFSILWITLGITFGTAGVGLIIFFSVKYGCKSSKSKAPYEQIISAPADAETEPAEHLEALHSGKT